MPLSLGDLKRDVRHLRIKFMNEDVNLAYRPSAITPALGSAMTLADSPAVLMINTCLTSWDIVDDEQPQSPDKPTFLAINEQNIAALPSSLVMMIKNAIQDDIVAQSKKS